MPQAGLANLEDSTTRQLKVAAAAAALAQDSGQQVQACQKGLGAAREEIRAAGALMEGRLEAAKQLMLASMEAAQSRCGAAVCHQAWFSGWALCNCCQ